MSRKPTATEIKITLAHLARIPPDDVDGYVVILAKDADVGGVLTNAVDEATLIALLARAIEHRCVEVGKLEAGAHG